MHGIRNALRLGLITSALLLALPAVADHGGHGKGHGDDRRHGGGDRRKPASVPEFDPSVVGVIAAMVAGGAVVVARRRKQ